LSDPAGQYWTALTFSSSHIEKEGAAMKAIWNGSISFGLVNIPINLFSCLKERSLRFHFLHQEDQGRIRNQMVCEVCGRVVNYKNIVRGYEYEKGKTVALTNKDLTAVRSESNRNIAITDFVNQNEIDPAFYGKPYYLAPGRNGERAYALLCQVLARTRQVGLGKLVLHTREHLAAIRANEEVLMLELLHFSDELRSPRGLGLSANKYEPTKRELDLAEKLISQLSTNFDPEKYQDTYQNALLSLVKQKLSGEKVRVPRKGGKATNVVNLMSRLKASLKEAKSGSRRRKRAAA